MEIGKVKNIQPITIKVYIQRPTFHPITRRLWNYAACISLGSVYQYGSCQCAQKQDQFVNPGKRSLHSGCGKGAARRNAKQAIGVRRY